MATRDTSGKSNPSRSRKIQEEYNQFHGITPQSVKKDLPRALYEISEADYYTVPVAGEQEAGYRDVPADEVPKLIQSLEKEMRKSAKSLKFERAAEIRDQIRRLKHQYLGIKVGSG